MPAKPALVVVQGKPVDYKKQREVSPNPAGRKSDKAYGRSQHKYLKPEQVEAVANAALSGRNGLRDWLMITMAAHHGFRVSELIDLKWDDIDLDAGEIVVNRLKGSKSTVHPLAGEVIRKLRQHRRESTSKSYLFVSQRGCFTRDGFNKLLKAAATRAGIKNVFPHSLRHSCGHALAVDGTPTRTIMDYLGHRNIAHSVRYTDGVAEAFKGTFWTRAKGKR